MRKLLCFLLCALMLVCALMPGALAAVAAQEAVILFTHDMHSHLESGETADMGGLGRISTLVQEARAERGPVFLVDAGDFSMGTLYQTIYETHAPELTMLGRVGYDAVTLGNHEYDYRGEGLSNMLGAALRNADSDPSLALPALVIANLDWESRSSNDSRRTRAAMDSYGAKPYVIVEHGGVRAGIFGLFGKDADSCAPLSGLTFEGIVAAAKRTVEQLKQEQVDLILCLSHSGTWADAAKSEDDLLAKAVPEIDVIVSGHSHTLMEQYHQFGSTYVVSSGSYTSHLGELRLIRNAAGRWDVVEYTLRPADASVAVDPAVTARLDEYQEAVSAEYLAHFGYQYGQVLCENPVDFGTDAQVQATSGESRLGSLLADAYIDAVKKAEGDAYRWVDLAIVPSGVIRGTLPTGTLTVNDAFAVSSLGIGVDRIPGYPLIDVYLTGRELLDAAEVDVSVSGIMDGVVLHPGGGGWEYNPNRLILNRATRVWVNDDSGAAQDVEPDRLYRVVVDLYCGQRLGAVNGASYGLLSLVPKDENGSPVTDYEERILHDAQGNEVKEWVAVAQYLAGMGTVDARYAAAEGRKLMNDSTSLGDLLSNPHKIVWVLAIIIAVLIALIVVTILLIHHCRRRKRQAK